MLLSPQDPRARTYFGPVRTIQRSWKTAFTPIQKLLENYIDPVQVITDGMSGPDLCAFLRRHDVLVGTRRLLHRILKLGVTPEVRANSLQQTLNVRIFLVAYLARYFFDHAFENGNNNERAIAVRLTGNAMLDAWHAAIASVRRGEVPRSTELRGRIMDYMNAFNIYYPEDARVLARERMANALRVVLQARMMLDPNHEALPVVNEHAARLREAIQRLPTGAEMLAEIDAWEANARGEIVIPYQNE